MPRISKLPALAQATSGDVIPIVDDAGNITKKVTANKVVPDGSVVSTQLANGAVTTAKIGDSQVTASKIDFSTFEYSTTEKIVGKWVDGKTVYQKTINFGTLPNATTKTVPHGVTGIDFLVNIAATAKAGAELRTIPHINPATLASGMGVYISGADLVVQTATNQTAYTTCYITICYTKS